MVGAAATTDGSSLLRRNKSDSPLLVLTVVSGLSSPTPTNLHYALPVPVPLPCPTSQSFAETSIIVETIDLRHLIMTYL